MANMLLVFLRIIQGVLGAHVRLQDRILCFVRGGMGMIIEKNEIPTGANVPTSRKEASSSGGSQAIEFVSSDKQIGQGDVLYWKDAKNPFEIAGIIVTGDCDIANTKHWGKLSVVPVISIDCYLEYLLFPKMIADREEQMVNEFYSAVKHVTAKGKDGPSKDTMDSMLGADKITDALSNNEKIVFLHSAIRHSRRIQQAQENKELLKKIVALLKTKGNEKDAIDYLRNTVQSHLKNSPGDVLMLPKIDGLPFKPAIIWLRIIREISESDIALKSSEEKKGLAVRLWRLQPTLRHKMTQKLAQVFSDIGLPDDYEAEVASEIKNFVVLI